MSQKTWRVVGLVAMLTLVVCWWAFRGKPSTPNEVYTKAAFTRPTRLAPSSGEFAVFIDGMDALAEVPTVASNQEIPIVVILPQDSAPGLLESIWVVPRLPSQDPEGFEWMDALCDLILGLPSPVPTPLGEGRECNTRGTFRLRPGEYVLRYYRQISNFDAEKGPPRNEFLGQGRLRVIPSESTEPSFVPLEDKKNIMRLFKPESEGIE